VIRHAEKDAIVKGREALEAQWQIVGGSRILLWWQDRIIRSVVQRKVEKCPSNHNARRLRKNKQLLFNSTPDDMFQNSRIPDCGQSHHRTPIDGQQCGRSHSTPDCTTFSLLHDDWVSPQKANQCIRKWGLLLVLYFPVRKGQPYAVLSAGCCTMAPGYWGMGLIKIKCLRNRGVRQ